MTQTSAAPAATLMRSPLIPSHTRWLESAGITREIAREFDVFSAETAEDIGIMLHALGATGVVADDVMEQAAALARSLPGVVFPWHQLNGEVRLQVRPDNPFAADSASRPAKYVSAKGVSLGISVPRPMRERLDTARVLMIVEGTKQHISAAVAAPADVLVVGLPGIQNWSEPRDHDDDGKAIGPRELHSDLAELVALDNIKTVVVVPDADWKANEQVHASVRALAAALVDTGDIDNRHLKVADLTAFAPAESKSGLDDILAPMAPAAREATVATILRDAKSLPKARTPKAVGIGDLIVDKEFGVIRSKDVSLPGGVTSPGSVVMGAAVEMVRTRTTIDPGAPADHADMAVTADLDVTIGSAITEDGADDAGQFHTVIDRVPDADIDDPRKWLGPRLGGDGLRVAVATGLQDRRAIGNAIRTSASEVERVREIATAGHWTSPEGERFFIPGAGPAVHLVGGRLTEDSTTVGAVPVDGLSTISVDAASATPERVAESARTWRVLMDGLGWTPAAVAAFGQTAASLLGFRREGREHKTGILMLAGRPASGKSEIAHACMSLLGREHASTSAMSFASDTDMVLREFCDHCQPGVIRVIDDFVGRQDAGQDQPQILDAISRLSYDGASRSRKEKSQTGRGFVTSSARRDQCMAIVTGERQPAGLTSALERMLVLPLPFHPWDLAAGGDPKAGAAAQTEFSLAVSDGLLEPLGASLISDGLENPKTIFHDTDDWSRWLLDKHSFDARPRQLLAPILAGVSALLELAEVPAAQGQRVIKSIVDAVAAYWAGISDDSTSDPVQVVLDGLRGAVASGRYALDGATTLAMSSTMLGSSRSIGGEPVVCLIPSVASQITGQSVAQLNAILRPVVVPGGDGRAQKKVRIGTGSMRMFVLPESVWAGTPDGAVLDPTDVGDMF